MIPVFVWNAVHSGLYYFGAKTIDMLTLKNRAKPKGLKRKNNLFTELQVIISDKPKGQTVKYGGEFMIDSMALFRAAYCKVNLFTMASWNW